MFWNCYRRAPSVFRILALALAAVSCSHAETLWVEAEEFADLGGWVVDTQSIDQMGSPYAMAHGLGRIVAPAATSVAVAASGNYRVWVRTRDWVGQWRDPDLSDVMRATGSPGRFRLTINGRPLNRVFGETGAEWHWQDGGSVKLEAGAVELGLVDLTGFNGRCDAIVLSSTMSQPPPNTLAAVRTFRHRLRPDLAEIEDQPPHDLVVVGGIAGICSAISAARHGCRTALVQNRPVLGGNNSSEVRVGLSGLIRQRPYTRLGNLVDETDPVGHCTLHTQPTGQDQ